MDLGEKAAINPLAAVTAVAGFVVLFSWFATGAPATIVVGLVLLLGGSLWAGFSRAEGDAGNA